ncbi:MAG: 4'-phosphopantetheinyl transferase superfamily protein [Tannerella sp.]|jgi:4'-phosphopantetheinyl transferase EntD|nr:4'-phosphopantetheinyl transferase superfamily protein [Tannerella sp.]
MPLLNIYETPRIGIWEITEPWQELFDSLTDKDVYCSDVMKISSDKRKQEWLAVRLLLQHLSGSDIHIKYRENGAPCLPGSTCNISLSHTKGFAAIILSENKNPGIDIEYRSVRAWKLYKKYMNENERKTIIPASDTSGDSIAATAAAMGTAGGATVNTAMAGTAVNTAVSVADIATICWCAKETAFKALGATGVDFSEHFCIENFNFSTEGFLFLKEKYTEQYQRLKINYRIADEYILTWKE